MKISFKYVVLSAIVAVLIFENCKRDTIAPKDILPTGASKIEATTQRNGDATAGYNYLVTGDYVSSGIPLDIFKTVFNSSSPDDLSRTGDNKGIPFNCRIY